MREFLFESLEPRRMLSASFDVSVDPSVTYQEWTGFGASMQTWFNGHPYDDPQFFNQIVNDVGMNMLRLPVWQSFENENDDADPNTFNWDGFNIQALEATMRFAQELQKRGADTFFGSVWSPPYWMKTSATHQYGGMLRADMRDEYAEYLAAYIISAKRDYGIDIAAISLQNEPYFNEPYESTLYTPDQLALTMKVVHDRFQAEGLDTKIIVHEDLPVLNRWVWWEQGILGNPDTADMDFIWGTHWTNDVFYKDMKASIDKTGNPIWMTEAAGKDDRSWNGALRLSEDVSGMMNEAHISAFNEWQYNGNETSSLFREGQRTNRYYMFKHYAHWLRPGSVRMNQTNSSQDIDANKAKDVFATAWYNEKLDAQTLVLTNNHTAPVTFNFKIAGNRSNTWQGWLSTSGSYLQPMSLSGVNASPRNFSLTLPARSMVTLYDGKTQPDLGTTASTGRGNVKIVYPRDTAEFHDIRHMTSYGGLGELQQYATSENIQEEWINGRDALFVAAATPVRRTVAVEQLLIDLGADVNKQDNEGITPLMVAASNPVLWWDAALSESVDKMSVLVNAGADIHTKDNQGRTALHWSAQIPRFTFPQEENVLPSISTLGLEYLLKQGGDANKVDRFGRRPIDWARAENIEEHVAVLKNWTSDAVAPQTLRQSYTWDTRREVTIDFDEAMAALTSGSLEVRRINADGSRGATVPFSFSTTTLAPGNTQARLTLGGSLDNGYYRVYPKTGAVKDLAGNATPATAPVGEFWHLNGDTNRDQIVDIQDFLKLRQNFGKRNVGFSGGDFNYDGRVDISDFLILRANYGLSVGDLQPPGPDGDPLPPANPPNEGGARLASGAASGAPAGGTSSSDGVYTGSYGGTGGGRSSLFADGGDEGEDDETRPSAWID